MNPELLKEALEHIRAFHPALFGNYDANGVTVASGGLQLPHMPSLTLGAGLVAQPQRQFMGRPVGTPSAVPGVTFRIGGAPDVTDAHAIAIARALHNLFGRAKSDSGESGQRAKRLRKARSSKQ